MLLYSSIALALVDGQPWHAAVGIRHHPGAGTERTTQQLKGAMLVQLLLVWPQLWVIANMRNLYFSAVNKFDQQFIRPKGLRVAINGQLHGCIESCGKHFLDDSSQNIDALKFE